MKALYKSSRYITAAILGSLVLSAGAAVALTQDAQELASPAGEISQVQDMGRFVVTPKGASYVRPVKNMGRIVISQHGATYAPFADDAKA